MRTRSLTVALICTSTLLVGCGGDDASAPAEATTGPSATASASPSATPTPSAKPTADASIGPATSLARYAYAYCQALKDNSDAGRKISAARALAERPAGESTAALKQSFVEQLEGFRADVLENVNNLRRAGSPKIAVGKKLAEGIARSYDYIDLVDDALAALDAIEATKAADYAAAAKKIIVKLQNDIHERLLSATRSAPESDEFTDATIKSKICPRSP